MKAKLNLNKDGSFKVENVDQLSYLYFPLTNYHSLKSAITPSLNGDAKIDQNSFLLLPTSAEDLHNSFMNRNVYFRVNNQYTWSITGNTPHQMLQKDNVTLDADFLYHKITRETGDFSCVIESFVPFENSYQELHRVRIKNTGTEELTLKPVVSIPMFSRSADNLRDHRHVTALLNKAELVENGIINQPTFSFDERGHIRNEINYGVFANSESTTLKAYWPVLEEFIGEGGTLLDPVVLKEELDNSYQSGDVISGYELTGGFEFEEITLSSFDSLELIFAISADKDRDKLIQDASDLSSETFDLKKERTIQAWHNELSSLKFNVKDEHFNTWIKWVTLQPTLRRVYGCSFLPHHDYGRGGRGWRDLWQDLLALILMNPTDVRHLAVVNNKTIRG